MLFVIVSVIVLSFGYLHYRKPVSGDAVGGVNADSYSDTEYTGEVYVYDLVSENDEFEMSFRDGYYKGVDFSFNVYYVNHTGVSSEGFSGGGSSSVEEFERVSGSWSKSSGSDTYSYSLKDDYAFALVDFSVEDNEIADNRSRTDWKIILAFLIFASSLCLLFLSPVIALNIFKDKNDE